MAIYARSTPKFLMRLKDVNGTYLDNTDVEQVRIVVYNSITNAIVTRIYCEGTAPVVTDSPAYVNRGEWVAADGDTAAYLKWYLTADETEAAKGNKNVIQVEIDVADADIATSNIRTIIEKGSFCEILPSIT